MTAALARDPAVAVRARIAADRAAVEAEALPGGPPPGVPGESARRVGKYPGSIGSWS